jgi:anaerobic C4-dicarboxylate transporter
MNPVCAERLRFILMFTALFGVVLFLTRPDPTRAQTIFRAGLIAIGVAGLAWLHFRTADRK